MNSPVPDSGEASPRVRLDSGTHRRVGRRLRLVLEASGCSVVERNEDGSGSGVVLSADSNGDRDESSRWVRLWVADRSAPPAVEDEVLVDAREWQRLRELRVVVDRIVEVLDLGFRPVFTPELVWFDEWSDEAGRVAARLHAAASQLRGELIAGQAAAWDISIGNSLKYELDVGFVEDLTGLRATLGTAGPATSVRLAEVATGLDRAIETTTDDLRSIVGSRYSASSNVEAALEVLRGAAETIDSLVSDCTAAIYVAGRR